MMLCYEGKLSLYCFVSAVFSLALQWIFFELGVFTVEVGFWIKAGFLGVYYLVLNGVIRLKFNTKDYQVRDSVRCAEQIRVTQNKYLPLHSGVLREFG